MSFYWDDWNRDHATRHGVSEDESEYVVSHRTPPDPVDVGDGKYRVWGPTPEGRLVQVVYCEIEPERMGYEELDLSDILALEEDDAPYLYVIHARDLTRAEKRALRRRGS